jgi:hypothetical protein
MAAPDSTLSRSRDNHLTRSAALRSTAAIGAVALLPAGAAAAVRIAAAT